MNDNIEIDDAVLDNMDTHHISASVREQQRQYTERRRKAEERLEAWKIIEELGIYGDDL